MAHAADRSMFFCEYLIIQGTILASAVGMQNTALCSLCMADGILNSAITSSFVMRPSIDVPTILFPAKVHDSGKIALAFIRWNMSNVTDHVLSGSVSGKVSV